MRIQEIIRNILDLIDNAEQDQTVSVTTTDPVEQSYHNDDVRRFKQIVDLADQGEPTEYSNTPKEEYASIESVTSAAGGGMQAPKHPSDIRGEHPSLYPGKVYGAR